MKEMKIVNIEALSIITRVQKMESCFDEVSKVLHTCPKEIQKDLRVQKMIWELTEYMESGQWLWDFECDSRGELPKGLKRGVLAEDALYNLLCEIDEI